MHVFQHFPAPSCDLFLKRSPLWRIRVVGTVFLAVAAGIAAAALVVFEGDLKWANDDMNENVYIIYIHIYIWRFSKMWYPHPKSSKSLDHELKPMVLGIPILWNPNMCKYIYIYMYFTMLYIYEEGYQNDTFEIIVTYDILYTVYTVFIRNECIYIYIHESEDIVWLN